LKKRCSLCQLICLLNSAMRIWVVYVIISAAFLLGSLQVGYGQTLEETYITTPAQTEDLKTILDQITRETGFLFTYPENMIREVKQVVVPAGTRSVSAMLDLALRDTGLRYWQSNRMVAIFKDLRPEEPEPEAPRVYTIQGHVTGSDGMPLPGATVLVKGEGNFTTTDTEGKFAIKATALDVLMVTSMTYKTKEVLVSGRALVDISLEENIAVLNEIVVNAGYWSVKERENTGNISWLSEEQIRRRMTTANSVSLLSGQMPGVFVQQRSGLPGGGYDLTIRGKNSLRSEGNYPLYLIDGVPYPASSVSSQAVGGAAITNSSPLSHINPADIERIEVLKDADATAIYGSRGANGVVLITTKRGQPGKTSLDINVYQGTGQITRTMPLLNTRQWVAMRKEAFKNDHVEIRPEQVFQDRFGEDSVILSTAPDITEWDTTRNVDWQKELLGGVARITQAQIGVNSGTEQTQFYFGGGFYKETTVFPGDFGMVRGSGHFNLNHRSTNNRFKLGFTASYMITSNKLPAQDFTGKALELAPNAPDLYSEDGSVNRSWERYWFNPAMLLERLYKSTTDNLMASGFMSYSILPGLTLKNTFGYTKLATSEVNTTPISSQQAPSGVAPSTLKGSSGHADNSIHTWISEPQIEFEHMIGLGKLSVLAGATYQESILSQKTLYASGYTSDPLIESLTAATSIETVIDAYDKYRYNAVFGRINYNWDGKYILNLTGRRDGSSRFGPGNRYGVFGAAGASWIFSREWWIEDRLTWLSFGRLRASYGTTGSDQIGDYQFLDAYASNDLVYYGTSTTAPTRLVNSDYSWEVNRKLEAALRVDLFRDRLMMEASWYSNRSTHQLIGKSVSEATGFDQVQMNWPVEVLNTGWEFLVSSVNVASDRFSWRTSLNVTLPRNELKSFPDLENSSYANVYAVGYPLSVRKMYKFTGVNSQTGLYDFEDVNADGVINNKDRQSFNVGIYAYGGLQNTIVYNAWELDVYLQWVNQDAYNGLFGILAYPGTRTSNQSAAILDRWQEPGDDARFSAFSQNTDLAKAQSFANFRNSDRTVSDASYIRLRNVSLAYHLRREWIERMHLKQCKLYVQGQNLATWTRYLGSDPETQDVRTAPPLRLVSVGVQLTL
jgi:TonB-linked SusC/RagA family outer membrane protein